VRGSNVRTTKYNGRHEDSPWLKIGWTIWVMVWVPVYWKQYGLQNFLFFCDLGNILITLGLWLESPLIFSWQATGLLLYQTLYAST
jgi:hypothetical protein